VRIDQTGGGTAQLVNVEAAHLPLPGLLVGKFQELSRGIRGH
jgi:hypothetical protein